MEKNIEIRKRNEDLIKFWAQYLLLLMIALIGVHFMLPKGNMNMGFAILCSLIATFLCFAAFMIYHKKTSDIIRKN
jgi:hypothetical protein